MHNSQMLFCWERNYTYSIENRLSFLNAYILCKLFYQHRMFTLYKYSQSSSCWVYFTLTSIINMFYKVKPPCWS